MKFATLIDQDRQQQLWIVSRDLQRCIKATDIVCTLQDALNDWQYCFTDLQKRYERLNNNEIHGDEFKQERCLAPLPFPRQFKEYASHRNHSLDMQYELRSLSQYKLTPAVIDNQFITPHTSFDLTTFESNADCAADVVVVTSDVPKGISAHEAEHYIRLVMLANDLSFHSPANNDSDLSAYFYDMTASRSFSPVAVTVDELSPYWESANVHLPLYSFFNGHSIKQTAAQCERNVSYAHLLAAAAKNHMLKAGTIVGSGLLSNLYLASIFHHQNYSSSRIAHGLRSRWKEELCIGDAFKVEMYTPDGQSIFGSINHTIV